MPGIFTSSVDNMHITVNSNISRYIYFATFLDLELQNCVIREVLNSRTEHV